MNVYEAFKTDPEAEKNGIPVHLPPIGSFIVARAGGANKAFTKMFTAETRPYKRLMDMGIMEEETANEILVRCFAKTVILDWRDVKDEDDNPLPFTVDNCIKLLTDLPDLLTAIREEAFNFSNFLQADREEAAGKSETSSNGS